MTQREYRTAAATAAVRRKRQERLARDLISWGWLVYAPEDRTAPWDDGGMSPPLEHRTFKELHVENTMRDEDDAREKAQSR